jgi:hypothetical protein
LDFQFDVTALAVLLGSEFARQDSITRRSLGEQPGKFI